MNLKPGDVVKLRNGTWILVAEGGDFFDIAEGRKMVLHLDDYDENGNCTIMCNECLDIVFAYSNPVLNVVHYDKIWERKFLTAEERVILNNLDKNFLYITRDKNGDLWLWSKDVKTEELLKDSENESWGFSGINYEKTRPYLSFDFTIYNHLFKCVSWDDEQPTSIVKLLSEEYEYVD